MNKLPVPTVPKYTAPREHNGRLPRRDAVAQNQTVPREHNCRLPRKNTSIWRTRPPPSLTPPVKQRGLQPKPGCRLPCERHLSKGKPPSTHLMAEYWAPPTLEGPLGKFLPFTLDPRIATKENIGLESPS